MSGDYESCDQEKILHTIIPNCTDSIFDLYTNQCVPAQVIQFEDQENEWKMQIIYGVILPLLAIAVVLSNSIVIVVLAQQKTKRASVEPLLWMAICSLLMAISPLPFTIYYYNLSHHLDFNQTIFLCYLQKVCMEILPFFFNTLVTLFTILLGVQRFIAVQYPLQSIRWCTPRMVRRYSKLILVVAILLTGFHSIYDIRLLYHFCIQYGGETFWVSRCFIGYSSLTSAMGAEAFSAIFDYFRIGLVVLSSGLLFVVTILLIQTIRTHDNEKPNVHRHKNRKTSHNTTIMLTVIIVIYMLARAPSTLLILLVKVMDYMPVPQVAFEIVNNVYLRVFANITVISLHPISFAVYMFMSRKFRVSLRRLLGWRFLASDEEFAAFTSSTRIHTGHNGKDELCPTRKINRPGRLFDASTCSINDGVVGDSSLSILDDLADEAAKASQGLLTPEEIPASPRRTPIEILTSVPEEDEEAQKTRTSMDLRKWQEMMRKEEEEKKKKKKDDKIDE